MCLGKDKNMKKRYPSKWFTNSLTELMNWYINKRTEAYFVQQLSDESNIHLHTQRQI